MRNTRGDLSTCLGLVPPKGEMKGGQKSAEGIRAPAQGAKARTWKDGGTDTLTDETDARRKAEMPEDSRRIGDGISEGTGRERQTPAAVKDTSTPETTMLLEEVLRHENLTRAYQRVYS